MRLVFRSTVGAKRRGKRRASARPPALRDCSADGLVAAVGRILAKAGDRKLQEVRMLRRAANPPGHHLTAAELIALDEAHAETAIRRRHRCS